MPHDGKKELQRIVYARQIGLGFCYI
jgi:hypothetical protein